MEMTGKKNMVNTPKFNLGFLSNFFNLSFIQVSNVLIQLFLFPLIIHVVGLEKFGKIMVINSIALLAGQIVNYGTGLSGIKDTAAYQKNSSALGKIFFSVLYTRLFLTLVCVAALPVLYLLQYEFTYLLLAVPIVLAETVNPLFFFTGIEKLFLYNLANLLAKLSAAVCILFLIKSGENAPWVNFYLGIFNFGFYFLLSVYSVIRFKLARSLFYFKDVVRILKQNFYLVGNNISVQLQQSFFLFAVSAVHNPLLLGAYSVCDKVVWSFRLLLTAFSGAIFPTAVRLYSSGENIWNRYKTKTNQYLAVIFALAAVILFFFSPFITKILTGGYNALTVTFIRSASLVPLVSSMNVLNVLDLLIRNRYIDIFKIAMILLAITVFVSTLLITFGSATYFGYFPLIIESCSIPLYLYFIKKMSVKKAE